MAIRKKGNVGTDRQMNGRTDTPWKDESKKKDKEKAEKEAEDAGNG